MTNWSFEGGSSHRGFNLNGGLGAPSGTNSKTGWNALTASLTVGGWFIFTAKPGAFSRQMYDVGIGGAGAEKVIVENIYYDAQSDGQRYRQQPVHCPIYIPTGTRVSYRYQSNTVSTDSACHLSIVPVSSWMAERKLSRAKSFGANTGSTIGTDIDPGGSIGTYGSWTNVGSTTTNSIRALIACIGRSDNTTLTECDWIVQVGWGSTAQQVVEFTVVGNSLEDFATSGINGPFPVNIPAGEQIKVRAKCSINDATDRIFDIVLLGFS